jgi:hypothetical protein
MTINEKLEMFRGKKAFIDSINKAFETRPAGSSVSSVEYEVYRLDLKDDVTYFTEYLVVTFFGGGKTVRVANGNSNTANFRALGTLVDGGYYDEVGTYESLTSIGYTKVEL